LELDWQEIHDRYVKDGYVIISDILDKDVAEEIYQNLVNSVEWETCLQGEKGAEFYTSAEINAMSPEKKQQLNRYMLHRAASNFSFLYHRINLGKSNNPILRDLIQYITGDEFLGFVKYITGELEINKVDGQASRYQRTEFLNMHNDKIVQEDRKAAYVMGLTKKWRVDFGGLLHILNDDWTIREVHIPQFNCMTIFKIPREHFVSQVATYTPVARYTVNGWFIKS
jgi:Rps23 Pro-64 3,4-dihydroxylase Tpa1-like proline 4-hydroxylase